VLRSAGRCTRTRGPWRDALAAAAAARARHRRPLFSNARPSRKPGLRIRASPLIDVFATPPEKSLRRFLHPGSVRSEQALHFAGRTLRTEARTASPSFGDRSMTRSRTRRAPMKIALPVDGAGISMRHPSSMTVAGPSARAEGRSTDPRVSTAESSLEPRRRRRLASMERVANGWPRPSRFGSERPSRRSAELVLTEPLPGWRESTE